MSFASEVKKEILTITENKNEQIAFTLGALQGLSTIILSSSGVKLQIKSPILNIIKKILPILKEQFSLKTQIGFADELIIKNKRRYYYLEITEHALDVIEYYKLMLTDELNMENELIQTPSTKEAFIRGVFASKGSINDPRKECYHLEMACKKYDVAFVIQQILGEKGIDANIVNRRGIYITYIKKSEIISDFLAYIGASSGVFYFEDYRIYRDSANMANRMANCDIANERKCLETCNKQLDAIEYIRECNLFEKMPVRLQTISRLREEYPESSLEELAYYSENIFGKQMSKSGISHCLRDLMEYYQNLVNKKNNV
jgi:DNA-binding protein WhiA